MCHLCMAFRLYILITTINCIFCAVYSACDQNVCQNGGTCSQHIFEYMCECTSAHSGSFCEMSTSEWTTVYTLLACMHYFTFLLIPLLQPHSPAPEHRCHHWCCSGCYVACDCSGNITICIAMLGTQLESKQMVSSLIIHVIAWPTNSV